ncbi:MAG TPA: hypothetical protein VH475_02500, partial [Tepidisphaeraceae bacterium]
MSSIAFPPDDTTSSLRAPTPTTDNGPRTTDVDPITLRNRQNALKSTGPRTQAGKSRSAQNAKTHGLTAHSALTASADTPLPPDLTADPTFQLARDELIEELRPITPMQRILVNQIAHLTWKLDQIPHLERQILANTPAPQDSALSTQDSTALVAHHLLEDRPTPLTRLWDLHRRLLARTQSLLRQLLQLQKHQQDRDRADAQLESDRERSRRRAKEDAALTEHLNRLHQQNQQRNLNARITAARRQPSDDQQPTPAPHPLIPSPAHLPI